MLFKGLPLKKKYRDRLLKDIPAGTCEKSGY